MINVQSKKMAIVLACVVMIICLVQGVKGYRMLGEKTVAQEGVTESLQRWRQSYLALSDSRAEWNKRYRREDSIQDIISLFTLIGLDGYGLVTDPDGVVLTKVEPVVQNNSPIGLTKICLATGSADGNALLVQASSYQNLLAGIDKLAKRPDLYIGNISLQGDKQVPLAKLGDFCVLLRTN